MPTDTATARVTALLSRVEKGDRTALDQLLPLVYRELHRLAVAYMRRESSGHTLQPTALVNEAFLKLIDQHSVQWQNRAHFFGIAGQLMRRILIKHAVKKRALKRGGSGVHVSFDESFHGEIVDGAPTPDLLALDQALEKLERIDDRQARIVELRYFAGLRQQEIAHVLDISEATVKREWRVAKAWLFRELSSSTGVRVAGAKREGR